MAIRFIDNQPIDFRGHLPSYSACKANNCDSYCSLYDSNDTISFQFINEGTGNEMLCNHDLINTNPELVANGNFDVNAGGWTLTGFIYDAVNHRVRSTGAGDSFYQSLGITVGQFYQVILTVYIPTGSYVTLQLGSTPIPNIQNSGTYTFIIPPSSGTNLLIGASSANVAVDTISVKKALIGTSYTGYCFKTSNSNTIYNKVWYIDDISKTISHSAGNVTYGTNPLSTYISPSASNGSFRLQMDVNGVSGGTLTVKINGANLSNYPVGVISASGHYDYFVQYTGLVSGADIEIILEPTVEFGASISNLSVIDYTLASTISLIGGHSTYLLNGYVSQYNEFITVKVPLYFLGLDDDTYHICVDEIPVGTMHKDMIADSNFSTCDWYGDSTCASGVLNVPTSTGRYQYIFSTTTWDVDMYASSTMAFDFDILTRDWDTFGSPSNLYLIDQSNNQIVANLITDVQANTHYVGSIVINVNLGTWDPAFRLDFDSSPGDGDKHEFESIQLIQTAQSATTYCSNCIDIKSSHRCSVWISGKCDTSALDFDFHNNFEIGGRVRAMLINPKYKGSNQRYLDHNGKSIITSTATGKVYTLLIDYAPEKTHDWLRMALACDIVKIGDTYATSKQFVSLDGDYTPEWIDNIGNFPLSQCRVEVQALIDEKYNNNPG